jgi:hypothetical protein
VDPSGRALLPGMHFGCERQSSGATERQIGAPRRLGPPIEQVLAGRPDQGRQSATMGTTPVFVEPAGSAPGGSVVVVGRVATGYTHFGSVGLVGVGLIADGDPPLQHARKTAAARIVAGTSRVRLPSVAMCA